MEKSMTRGRTVGIIGAGYTGASIAYALSIKGIADEIILVDQNERKAMAEVDDIRHGIPFMDTTTIRHGDYFSCRNCNLIIMTAGVNRRADQTRMDLAEENVQILRNSLSELKKYYLNGPVLVVTNPVDIITKICDEILGFDEGKVLGTGCLLDTSRLTIQIADYVGLKATAIGGFVAGEHGEHQTPVWSSITVAGIPIEAYCNAQKIEWNDTVKNELQSKALNLGTSIIAGKGRTHYGIATCVCLLVDAILNNRPTVACVSSVLKGEYGITDVALSVPSIIDANGVHKRFEEVWMEDEKGSLRESAKALKSILENLRKRNGH